MQTRTALTRLLQLLGGLRPRSHRVTYGPARTHRSTCTRTRRLAPTLHDTTRRTQHRRGADGTSNSEVGRKDGQGRPWAWTVGGDYIGPTKARPQPMYVYLYLYV